MNGKKLFHRLYFDNDEILDEKIDTVTGINLDPFIDEREGDLGLDLESDLMEFPGEAPVVRTFQKPRSEYGVHFYRTFNNCARDCVDWHFSVRSVGSVVNVSLG